MNKACMAPLRLPESHIKAAFSSEASEDISEVISLDSTAYRGSLGGARVAPESTVHIFKRTGHST